MIASLKIVLDLMYEIYDKKMSIYLDELTQILSGKSLILKSPADATIFCNTLAVVFCTE